MIDAINLVWDPRTGRQDLWPLLLNQYPKDLKPIDIITKVKVSENGFEAVFKKITSLPKISLNKSQLDVIQGTKSLIGGVQLVQAPGGTGKTTIISLLTHAYGQTSIYTLLCASTNTVVGELCLQYTQLLGEEFVPLRVYASDLDQKNAVLGINRREGIPSDELSYTSTDISMLDVDENEQPHYVGEYLDMCKELRDFHSKAQNPAQKSYFE